MAVAAKATDDHWSGADGRGRRRHDRNEREIGDCLSEKESPRGAKETRLRGKERRGDGAPKRDQSQAREVDREP